MPLDAADHDIGPRLREIHDFTPVTGLQAWIESSINPVRRVIDQRDPCGCARGRRGLRGINVARLRAHVIDDYLVKPTDEEVDRPVERIFSSSGINA
jgi:hypothetical protein